MTTAPGAAQTATGQTDPLLGGLRGRMPDLRATPRGDTPALDQYTIDLTALAREGRLDPIRGRDEEIRQVIDILLRRRQNNPILTGEAGVGKTAVVEGFAQRVVQESLAEGVWVYPAGSGPLAQDAVMLGPGFTITEDELDEIVTKVGRAVDRAAASV